MYSFNKKINKNKTYKKPTAFYGELLILIDSIISRYI